MTVPQLKAIHQRHPTFWLDDGSLIIAVQNDIFKVHRTLLCRHSRALAKWPITRSSDLPGVDGCDVVLVPQEIAGRMRSEDVLALLEHVYHDVPLSADTSFSRLAGIIRVSSPKQLDFPTIYQLAKGLIEGMFPGGPEPFRHPDCLQAALALAVEYEITSIQKALYYSLVATSDFDMDGNGAAIPNPDARDGITLNDGQPAPPHRLSPEAAQRCTTFMHSLIAYFTPILFTPAATPHMACTDVFADTWMRLVIDPALQYDGVYKPLETLEKMRAVDWRKEGLCESCVEEKMEEWRGEQVEVWRRMDGWLAMG